MMTVAASRGGVSMMAELISMDGCFPAVKRLAFNSVQ
jgi:hypothetical protein